MSSISIGILVGLLIALLAILLLYPRQRKVKPQIVAYGSQRMCPACGLITSRLEACCLACGESLAAVSVTQIVGK
jgi:hypothetical protein